jgi:hypothetical protein
LGIQDLAKAIFANTKKNIPNFSTRIGGRKEEITHFGKKENILKCL